ncbi:hypothetical protein B0H17DRAFT_15555 [Mycena rosella]|uniref:Uncharacterized protein n=1 Tax=Mycena rosella TaxID=1033263 RepID=A0AAD7F9D5_MYCRO|nr:hypothetical protein B0H17DRAFT_15555 [Mycena rosella]
MRRATAMDAPTETRWRTWAMGSSHFSLIRRLIFLQRPRGYFAFLREPRRRLAPWICTNREEERFEQLNNCSIRRSSYSRHILSTARTTTGQIGAVLSTVDRLDDSLTIIRADTRFDPLAFPVRDPSPCAIASANHERQRDKTPRAAPSRIRAAQARAARGYREGSPIRRDRRHGNRLGARLRPTTLAPRAPAPPYAYPVQGAIAPSSALTSSPHRAPSHAPTLVHHTATLHPPAPTRASSARPLLRPPAPSACLCLSCSPSHRWAGAE